MLGVEKGDQCALTVVVAAIRLLWKCSASTMLQVTNSQEAGGVKMLHPKDIISHMWDLSQASHTVESMHMHLRACTFKICKPQIFEASATRG